LAGPLQAEHAAGQANQEKVRKAAATVRINRARFVVKTPSTFHNFSAQASAETFRRSTQILRLSADRVSESCVQQSGVEMPYRAIKTNIADCSLHVIAHISRRPGCRFRGDAAFLSRYNGTTDSVSFYKRTKSARSLLTSRRSM
jgi:hypothetical protein